MSKFLDETGLAYFWNKIQAALSTVAFSGSYNDLTNKPNIPASSTVDTALSSTSENPVQNKVINTALGTKANDSDVVKLSGNQTVAGTKTFSSALKFNVQDFAFRSSDSSYLSFQGGSADGNGAIIRAYGKDHTNSGWFFFRAKNASQSTDMIGKPDGTLTWGGKAIAIDENVVHLAGAETITGTKTFTANSYITKAGPVFFLNRIYEGETPTDVADVRFQNNGTSEAVIRLTLTHGLQLGAKGSGANWYNGPALMLNKNNTFSLRSGYGGTTYALVGSANGTLTWVNKGFVYDSGDQTITGQKTLNTLVVTGSGNLRKTDDTHDLWLCGGIGNTVDHGAYIGLYGASNSGSYPGFFSIATGKVNNKYAQLLGNPDGTLTWDGKDIITNGGDQTIAGTKTFSISPICERGNPYFITCETDLEKGVAPSGTTYQGVVFKDKNAVEVGSVFFSVGKSSNLPYGSVVFRNAGNGTTADNHELVFRETTNSIWHFMPSNTTDINLGGSGNYRWKEVWSVTGAINTSDERLKDNIASVPDAVLDAWGDVKWSQFQMRDAITEKGADKARLHNGLIAQRIEEVFKAHGQDASRYGLFCHDAWDADEEREAGDEYSLRYEEALCMEAAYQRRRADRAEARITALEEQIAEIKSRLEVK